MECSGIQKRQMSIPFETGLFSSAHMQVSERTVREAAASILYEKLLIISVVLSTLLAMIETI